MSSPPPGIQRRYPLSTTLLLDLDDTLVKNNINQFLPRYLQAYSNAVADLIDPELFIRSLLAGTRAMAENRLPDCTLKEVFDSVFYPLTGVDPALFQAEADRFYDQVFPSLRNLTGPIPQAVEAVREARNRGYRLAVTTNPLFPRQAILQRLEWAGLSVDEFPFELITSFETFHYAKPDPAYLGEALGRLGWPVGPVIVIGDDLERDIIPARNLGLPYFWVSPDPERSSDPQDPSNGVKSIAEFIPWLDQSPPEALLPDHSSRSAFLATLRATPAVLDSFSRILPEVDWARRPEPEEWSLTEIFCHLRDVEMEVNLPRIHSVIESSNPFLPGQDTDPWADARQYCLQNGMQALRQFFSTRHELVELLESLDQEGWQRPARHAIFGPTRLHELVNIIASHDRLHVQQLHRLIERISPERLNN